LKISQVENANMTSRAFNKTGCT